MASGSMSKINLIPSLVMLLSLVVIYGAYKINALIMLLAAGATAEVAASGNVIVPEIINNTINATIASIAAGYTLINAGDIIILGLIGLVVILTLFWPLIGGFMKTGSKKKKASGGFN